VVSIGTLTATLVHPREVFAPAISCGAASLVVAHNHPSGDPTPSHEDRLLTQRLSEAGRLLGLQLDDHLVIGRSGYVSLRQLGILVA
jgi:DNA repair protein RadC